MSEWHHDLAIGRIERLQLHGAPNIRLRIATLQVRANCALIAGHPDDARLRLLALDIAAAALDLGLWNWSSIRPDSERPENEHVFLAGMP